MKEVYVFMDKIMKKTAQATGDMLATIGLYGEKLVDTLIAPCVTNKSGFVAAVTGKELFRSLRMINMPPEAKLADDFYRERAVTEWLLLRKAVANTVDIGAAAIVWNALGVPWYTGLFFQASTLGRLAWDGLSLLKYAVDDRLARKVDRARAAVQLGTTFYDNGTWVQFFIDIVYSLAREGKVPSYMRERRLPPYMSSLAGEIKGMDGEYQYKTTSTSRFWKDFKGHYVRGFRKLASYV